MFDLMDPSFSTLLLNAKLINRGTGVLERSGVGRIWRDENAFQPECAFEGTSAEMMSSLFSSIPAGSLVPEECLVNLEAELPDGTPVLVEQVWPRFGGRWGSWLRMHHRATQVWSGTGHPRPTHCTKLAVLFPFRPASLNRLTDGGNGMQWGSRDFVDRRVNCGGTIVKFDFQVDQTVVWLRSEQPKLISELIDQVELSVGFVFGFAAHFSRCQVFSGDQRPVLFRGSTAAPSPGSFVGPLAHSGMPPDNVLELLRVVFAKQGNDLDLLKCVLAHARSIQRNRNQTTEDYGLACSCALEHAVKACGLLNTVETKSVHSALKKWEAERCLSVGVARSFKEIRNRLAHGEMFSIDEIESARWKIELLRDAFYSLILNWMGYQGKVVRFAEPGWPIVDLNSTPPCPAPP